MEKEILKAALDAMDPELMDQELAASLLNRWKRKKDSDELPNQVEEYVDNVFDFQNEQYKQAKGID